MGGEGVPASGVTELEEIVGGSAQQPPARPPLAPRPMRRLPAGLLRLPASLQPAAITHEPDRVFPLWSIGWPRELSRDPRRPAFLESRFEHRAHWRLFGRHRDGACHRIGI